MTLETANSLGRELLFDPEVYVHTIEAAAKYIRDGLPPNFTPAVALTLGSGGLGEIAEEINTVVKPIPYNQIPGFRATTASGHKGELVMGYLEDVPVMGLSGRIHFYELGGEPNLVVAMKRVTFPVYVARALGVELYVATNAAGGLNLSYNTGDLMIIRSHVGFFMPNPLLGPPVSLMDAPYFQPMHEAYDAELRQLLRQAAKNVAESDHVHEGVYVVLTGRTYETAAESQALRTLGADAVGMSTVPEIIVATNLGMQTAAVSLISNVIDIDGTNRTSQQEVDAALNNRQTKQRVIAVLTEFFRLYAQANIRDDS